MGKFEPPRITSPVQRERLFRRLDAALAAGAVWIHGGAGAGKTTLLASYLSTRQCLTGWCQIDAGEGDVAVGCHALQQCVRPANERSPAARLRAPSTLGFPPLASLPPDDLDAFLRTFFRRYYAELSPPSHLVLDNAHEALASPGFRTLLSVALDEAPPGVHWLIASRLEAPAELSRLLANGLLTALEARELPFTEDESLAVQRQFFAEHQPTAERRSLAQMTALHQLSRGWPAILKLLLQLDPSELTALHAGDVPVRQSALFHYLAGEVFARFDAPTQALLLTVAHLPRIGADQAQALCGTPQATPLLARLAQDGLLTTPHPRAGETQYEFHPLLRGFLVRRAQEHFPAAELARIERHAAALLAAAGEREAAAQLLIAGHHWPELEALIRVEAPLLVAHGWQQTLSGWLHALPRQRRDDDPWLGYWLGEAQLHLDPPAAQDAFARAYHRFRQRHDAEGAFRAWCASVDLICLEWADFSQLEFWLNEVSSLGDEFGEPDASLVPRFTASRFSALMFWRPQDPAIDEAIRRLHAEIDVCPDEHQRLLLACNLPIYYSVVVGRRAPFARLMTVLQPSDEDTLAPVFAVLWQAIRAMYAWSDARLQDAAAAGARGHRLARDNGLRMWDFFLGALEIYACLSDGELERSRTALQRLQATLDRRRHIDVAHFHFLSALIELQAGDGPAALHAITQAKAIADRYGGPHQFALEALVQAEALHLCGRTAEAWPQLAQVRAASEALRSPMLAYQAGLSEAFLALETIDEERGIRALRDAFAIGREEDYLNHHGFRPAVMSRLCAYALEHGVETEYARRLIRGRRLPPPPAPPEGWPWPVRVHTLGRFGWCVDEVPANHGARPSAKPVQLLKALIAFGGRAVPVARVVAALWGEEEAPGGPPNGRSKNGEAEASRGAFDITLARLRQRLRQSDALQVDDGYLTLNPHRCWVDLWQLQRRLNETRATLAGNAEETVTRFAAHSRALLAFAPWDFLPAEDAPWARSAREALRAQVIDVLADLASALGDLGQGAQACALCRAALAVDPGREPLYRVWMRGLYEQGERAEALRVYRRCREALARELQTVPSPPTEALRRTIEEASPPPAPGA